MPVWTWGVALVWLGAMAAVSVQAAESTETPKEKGQAWYEAGEGGLLHVRVGKCHVQFTPKASWTIRKMEYADRPILTPTGFYNSVINMKNPPEGADPFIGSGHRPETLKSVTLTVDDKATDLLAAADEMKPQEGSRFVFRKTSRIGPLRHTAEVAVTGEGLRETFSFEAVEDTGDIRLMYPFMHCFPKTITQWLACDFDGKREEGVFTNDRSFTYNKRARWIAVADEEGAMGLVLVHPAPVAGFHKFWNRSHDNKLYLHVPAKAIPKSFTWTMIVRILPPGKKDWKARAAAVAKAIRVFPDAETPAKTDTPGTRTE